MVSKLKLSKRDFAEELCDWLFLFLSKEDVKDIARIMDFKIKGTFKTDKGAYNNLYVELAILHMYFIVDICERIFDDEDKRNNVLDIFHRIIYERIFKDALPRFHELMMLVMPRYAGYAKVIDKRSGLFLYLELEKEFKKNLFGEPIKDSLDLKKRLDFDAYISLLIQTLTKSIHEFYQKYDSE